MEKREIIRVALYSSLGTLFAVLLIGVGGYFAYTKFIAGWVHDFEVNQQSKAILSEVGKVVVLPADEAPQVATILDADSLKKTDNFFANAEDGDATVYYPQSGMIILFDMRDHKLLNMGMLATSTENQRP